MANSASILHGAVAKSFVTPSFVADVYNNSEKPCATTLVTINITPLMRYKPCMAPAGAINQEVNNISFSRKGFRLCKMFVISFCRERFQLCKILRGSLRSPHSYILVLYHTRILYHTRMVHTIRVWYVPYA